MKTFLWKFVGVVAVLYLGLVVVRMVHFYRQGKTDEQVAKINATKLTLDDVMGKNLPADPGVEADKTVQGIDANNNGIRDDVELAVFVAYPDSAKTRAVLLQYALALQLEMVQPIVNVDIVEAVASSGDRALNCVWSLSSREDMNKFEEETNKNQKFITERQINTKDRQKTQTDFYKQLGSYTSPNEGCDLDISVLPN